MEKVILAYSGGVDNLICIHWLRNNGFNVITFLAQIGQITYLAPLGEKAVQLGATVAHIADLRRKFINDFILPSFHAQAIYENGYLLSAALSRPLIAEELVRIAEEENCDTIAYGTRGIGNDIVRFENCIHSLDNKLKIITPLKELSFRTVKDDISYIKKQAPQIDFGNHPLHNIESNLWGVNILMGDLSHNWKIPPRDTYIITTPLMETLDKPTTIEIKFEQGIPISIDNKKMDLLSIIEMLNNIGGRNGIGRVDMVENKISGEKIREIYEAPAATILYTAYRALVEMLLPKELLQFQPIISSKYADLVYNGLWFSPLKQAMDKFFQEIYPRICGSVKLDVYKGNLSITQRKG
ncbi:MAG: argininosuccinate synthase [Planctomycetota bacterium]